MNLPRQTAVLNTAKYGSNKLLIVTGLRRPRPDDMTSLIAL
jgi:hypothetical protein